MAKRISLIFASVFILVSCIIPFASAEDEYIVVPEYDRQPLYEILPSVDQGGGAEPYIVYGIDVSSITLIDKPVGFITHFFGSNRVAGNYYVNMYSTRSTELRSRLRLFISNNETMVLWYEVGDFLTGNSSDYYQYQITPSISIDDDFMIVATDNGALEQYYYNTITKYPTIAIESLKYYFIGDIYIYGQTPPDVDNAIIQDAFNRGKAEGLIQGEDIGYQKGLEDSVLPNDQLQNAYDQGKGDGYQEGYNYGLDVGAKLDNEAVYQAGINKGQEQAQLVPNAINGFFDAILGFFQPFLSIGIGSLTLYSLLGVLVIVVVCILIIKITRG